MTINKNRKYINTTFILIILVIWIFLFWKCRFGYVSNDEAFYITLADRLYKGDSLLSHEWHRAQISSVLELPVLFIYRLFFKTNESLIINFRYIYTFIWGLFAIFVGYRLRKYSNIGSYIATIVIMLYTPFAIMALSYNTFSQMFLITSLVLLLTNEKKSKKLYVLTGMLFALAVLANPFLVLLYILYVLYQLIYKKADRNEFKYTFIGIASTAIVFLLFVFSRTSLSQIIESIPHMLNESERIDHNLLLLPKEYISTVVDFRSFKKYIYLVYFIEIVICLFDTKRVRHRDYYFILTALTCFVDILLTFLDYTYMNNLMYPLSMLGPVFLLYMDKDIYKLFFHLWLPGMVYTVSMLLSSDTGFHAISSGALLADATVVMMFFVAIKKMDMKKITIIIASLTIMLHIGVEFIARYQSIYAFDKIQYQTNYIDYGLGKGIYLKDHRYNQYNNLYRDLDEMKIPDYSKVLFISNKTWLYLTNSTFEYATYSAWLTKNPERLVPYFEMFPDKIPDYFYVDEDFHDFGKMLAEKLGFQIKYCQSGNIYCYKGSN